MNTVPEIPHKAIEYNSYFQLPEDIREYISQFAITDEVIPLIRKGMHNSRMVDTELALKRQSCIIAKPIYIKVSQDGVIIRTPTVRFTIPFNAVNLDTNKTLEQDLIDAEYEPDNLFGDFSLYNLYIFEQQTKWGTKTENYCDSYKIIAQKTDIEHAIELINKCGVINAFNRILGWKDNWAISRLNFVRLFSIITGETIFQLTGVNTGKTHFAIRTMLGLNYGYFTTSITPARLIYNASSKTEGEVFLRNGIIIDELSVINTLNEMEENLYSGLENGVWSRGVSGAEALSERKKKIPFMFFGNLPDKMLNQINCREYIGKTLYKLKFSNTSAFLDRIAITDVFPETINASEIINSYFYPNSIYRGYVEYLKKKYLKNRSSYNKEYISGNIKVGYNELSSGRMNKYINSLKCFADICGIPLSDTDAVNIVLGDIHHLDRIFKEIYGEVKTEPAEVIAPQVNYQAIAEGIVELINDWGGKCGYNMIIDELEKKGFNKNDIITVLEQLEENGEIVETINGNIRYYSIIH